MEYVIYAFITGALIALYLNVPKPDKYLILGAAVCIATWIWILKGGIG